MNPEESLLGEMAPQYTLASSGQRFANNFIDTIIVYLALGAIGVLIGYISSSKESEDFVNLLMILAYFLYFAYYIVLEKTTGKTIGKMITKTKVISQSGYPLTWGQCIGRMFSRLVPFEPFSGLSSHPIMWHDKWPNTWVVKDNGLKIN